jgi:hypothetical protein
MICGKAGIPLFTNPHLHICGIWLPLPAGTVTLLPALGFSLFLRELDVLDHAPGEFLVLFLPAGRLR